MTFKLFAFIAIFIFFAIIFMKTLNMKQKHYFYLFGIIMWPIIIATPLVVNAYIQKLMYSQIKFGEIPQPELTNYLILGFISSIFVLGFSYLVSYIVSKFKKNSKITGSIIFFVITILFTLLLIFSYGNKVIETFKLEKDNVEEIQRRVNDKINKKFNKQKTY